MVYFTALPWSLQVQFSPAVLAPGDTAGVILKKRNSDGSYTDFDASALFDVQMIDGFDYGRLYSPQAGYDAPWFFETPQGFRFIAADSIDRDSVYVNILVYTSGGIIAGAIPDAEGPQIEAVQDTARAFGLPGSIGMLTFRGATSDDDPPPGGDPADMAMGVGQVLIKQQEITEILLGETKYFQARLENENLIIEEVDGPNLNGGIADASVWGDSMRIYVSSLSNPLLKKDSVTIAEKVPDLELLPDTTIYVKVGGNCNHHGPEGPVNCSTPDNNHYGTETLVTAIQTIASQFALINTDVKLRINDMSLPFGGKFDIYGSWRDSHSEHREGRNVDISGLVLNNNGEEIALTEEQRRELRRIIRTETGFWPIWHNPPHFHVYTNIN